MCCWKLDARPAAGGTRRLPARLAQVDARRRNTCAAVPIRAGLIAATSAAPLRPAVLPESQCRIRQCAFLGASRINNGDV
jgi:hypothetical protein